MSSVVEMTGVVKRFGAVTALNGLDFEVAAGEVHGFLGPNGAGKSTTLRLLLGMLRSNAGSVRVLGLDPWRDVATLHRRLAYVPGDVSLWPNLTGGEVIELLGKLQGGQDRDRRDRLLELFELDPTKKARTYSKGNRQKVALVAALATDAELFLLDEPTSGLDPLMEDAFRGCVRELRAQGRTVLLSSHILSEAEALSDRVSIIRAGQVVETGPLDQLRHLTRASVTADVDAVPPGLERLPGVHDVVVANHRISAQVDPAGLGPLLQALTGAGLRALTSTPPTLEDLFLRHYGSGGGAGRRREGDAGSRDAGSRDAGSRDAGSGALGAAAAGRGGGSAAVPGGPDNA
ncbi:ABC transporter ATP-binding protein [Arthrobacter sp. UYEF3]|uniref:ABC transporter ATP-binding protein n=1 Tax=Arthrobacter sp. UYEF3 TaxID=1756365 RepID=UPI00339ACF4B